MFIRRTQTRSTASGERYYTHRLVQSKRVDGKVRQITLLNLGRHFDVDQEEWPLLCTRIEELLSHQASLVETECSPAVERHAQRIAAQLVVRGKESDAVKASSAPTTSSPSSESSTSPGSSSSSSSSSGASPAAAQQKAFHTVDVDSMALVRPRTVGVEAAALWAMQQVDFVELLESLGFTGPQRAAAIGSIIGRMAAPASELATHDWLGSRSGLGELLDVDYEIMSLSSLYRVSDRLLRHKPALEAALFERTKDLFGLDTTITLYDLTNTYFEGEMADNPKAKRGHSKEKRSDCPLLTLGLVLDGSGFVRRSEVFEGNVHEARTLEEMLEGLHAPKGALVVMDRGIATKANLAWLREQDYRYLVVSRERKRRFDPERAVSIQNASGETLHLEKVLSEDEKEVRLYCRSERRAKKEEAINERFVQRFEQALDKIAAGLSKPRTIKRLDKLWQRIGRLKEKSRGVGQYYDIELIPDAKGEKAVELRYTRKATPNGPISHPGVYCLRSSETDWDEETLWRSYITLTDLEAVFRSLKSELGLRPVFHHKEERADGHLFITVLAYQFVQILRRKLADQGIHASWHTLRQQLSGQVRVTAIFQQPDGHTLHVRKATRPEGLHLEICQVLGIDTQPGGVHKYIH